jgi:hypothetical protein
MNSELIPRAPWRRFYSYTPGAFVWFLAARLFFIKALPYYFHGKEKELLAE